MKMMTFTLSLMTAITMISAAAAADDLTTSEISAQYQVPTDREHLKPFSTFDLEDAKLAQSGSQTKLSFSLPKDLVGDQDLAVTVAGANLHSQDPFVLTSAPGADTPASATCRESADQTMCNVRYAVTGTYGVGTAIYLLFKDPAHYIERMQVAQHFAGDPIGVITIKTHH